MVFPMLVTIVDEIFLNSSLILCWFFWNIFTI